MKEIDIQEMAKIQQEILNNLTTIAKPDTNLLFANIEFKKQLVKKT